MTADELTSVDEALTHILGQARSPAETEMVSLDQSLGRVLAENCLVPMDVPPADNSAVDGYALRYADAERPLPVSDRLPAGEAPRPLQPGTAVRIFTGSEIPPGADTVVMQENVTLSGDTLSLDSPATQGQNIRPRGQDLRKGTVALQRGTPIRPQEIGLLASIGTDRVSVFSPLKVAILSTGDELVEPGNALKPGQIYNTNRYTLAALLSQSGCDIVVNQTLRDQRESTEATLAQAAIEADLIITSGGVSVGEEDHVRQVLEASGGLSLWRLAMKPGKPLAFGHYRETPVLGLPGNPAAALVTFLVIALPYIRCCQGNTRYKVRGERLEAGFRHDRPSIRREYVRARKESGAHGPVVTAYPNQSSGMLSSACWADGLALVPENSTIEPGNPITFYSFTELLG